MESDALLRRCIAVLEDRKGEDVAAFDVRGQSSLTDYYLFCTGNSTTQLRALWHHLDETLGASGVKARSVEGTPESHWILVDYNDVLIHLFLRETRELYNIEALLAGAPVCYPPSGVLPKRREED